MLRILAEKAFENAGSRRGSEHINLNKEGFTEILSNKKRAPIGALFLFNHLWCNQFNM